MALTDGLLTLWNMERHGKDAVGTLNLTASGTAITNTGVKANRLSWSNWFATNRVWSVADDNTLDLGDNPWTVRVVVSLFRKSTTMGLVTKDDDSGDRQWRLEYDQPSDRFRLRIFDSSNSEVADVAAVELGSPQLHSTYDIVAGYSKDTGRAFISVNGGDRTFGDASAAPGTGTAPVRVGTFVTGAEHRYLWGSVSEVAFWNREILNSERAALWNSGRLSYYPYVGSMLDSPHRTMAQNTAGSWWCLPKMVERNGKVYFGGTVANTFMTHVSQYTIATGETETFDLRVWGVQDEHNIPGLLIPEDAPPIVAYCGHNNDTNFYLRKGTVNGDIMSLGSEVTLTSVGTKTYAQIYRGVSNPNYVIIFTRASGQSWYYTESTDYGETWSALASVFSSGSDLVYIHTRQNGDRIDIHFGGNPNNTSLRGVWHCYLDMTDGELYETDGTAIGNISAGPYSESDMTQVFVPSTNETMRLLSGYGSDCLIALWPTGANSNGTYNILRRSGSSWTPMNLGSTGEPFGNFAGHYLAGGDFRDRNHIVLSLENQRVWIAQERSTGDGWNSWATKQIQKSATHKLTRPYYPIGSITPCVHVTSGYPSNTYTNARSDLVRIDPTKIAIGSPVSSVIVADNPEAYWRLNETSGATLIEESGAHSGSYVGAPSLGIDGGFDGFGTAVEFDGSQYANVPDNASIRFGSDDFAISCWVRCDVNASDASETISIASKGGASGSTEWMLYNNLGALRFRGNNGSINVQQAFGFNNLQPGFWHHVAVTRISGVVRLYLDGVMVDMQVGATANLSTVKILTLAGGNQGSERLWPGAIDEVALFVGTGLTPERIIAHYDAKLYVSNGGEGEDPDDPPAQQLGDAYVVNVFRDGNNRVMATIWKNAINLNGEVDNVHIAIKDFESNTVLQGMPEARDRLFFLSAESAVMQSSRVYYFVCTFLHGGQVRTFRNRVM